ncbi:MAG TPA: primosomal protein N' [Spirochaetota bacterium]|nr:primosomal protein N' [Spirochaetota bacterium]
MDNVFELDVIEVAVPLKLSSLYSYFIPKDLSHQDIVGKRVLVDFNGRKLRGYAVEKIKKKFTEKQIEKTKSIIKVLDKNKVFNEKQVDFAKWIADYYFAGIGEALSIMIPKGIRVKQINDRREDFIPKINTLSDKQNEIYTAIKDDIKNGITKFYIYGITGSGKTEIYVKLIEETINSGKSVIFLVPEIALSYQTLLRLKERFGSICAILHSNLSTTDRFGEYMRLLNGSAKIAIGPRSALFAPLENIGLIIIDEENEGAYKSEESPRFHARTSSIFWSNYNKSLLVLGSATPSIESYYYATKNYFKLYSLKERFGGAYLPDIKIIDNSFNYNNDKFLTLEMIEEINKRLQNKEQVVLLQNRRGFSSIIRCLDCKTDLLCPRCNITLTYHKSKEKLICHHCDYRTSLPDVCPSCNGKKLIKIGAGTQRIEDEISSIFGFAKIQRIDFDSLKSEKDLNTIFEKIESGEIDIIVGTQMIAKGLHFPKIKFVGIVNADIMLNIPDFKSSERTFSLITQVSGRSGRVGDKGFVMIQTKNPEHYSIVNAKEHNFEKFFNEEINYRSLLEFPPFFRLLRIVVRGKDENAVKNDITKIGEVLNNFKNDDFKIMGPTQCPLEKINNNFRYHILLKAKKIETVQELIRKSIKSLKVSGKNYLEIDVDPNDLF